MTSIDTLNQVVRAASDAWARQAKHVANLNRQGKNTKRALAKDAKLRAEYLAARAARDAHPDYPVDKAWL